MTMRIGDDASDFTAADNATKKYPQSCKTLKPYLRVVAQPK